MVYCCASRRVQRTTSGPAVCPTAWSDRPGCGSELVCWLCLPLGAWPLLVCPCKGGGRFTFFTRCQPILWSSADINLLSSDSVKFWRYVPGAGLPRWHSWWRTQLSVQETDAGSIPGLGRSPGGGHGNPLQCSFLENLVDRGACGLWSTGHKELDAA